METNYFKNPLRRSLPRHIRIGVWSSFVSAFMLIVIGLFWVIHPTSAEASFSIVADSDAAIRFAKITAIFKAVGDIIPPLFILLAISVDQFRLAGIFHLVTLLLVILVDMITWGFYVPEAGVMDILQHITFAIPIIIAAYCFLKPTTQNS